MERGWAGDDKGYYLYPKTKDRLQTGHYKIKANEVTGFMLEKVKHTPADEVKPKDELFDYNKKLHQDLVNKLNNFYKQEVSGTKKNLGFVYPSVNIIIGKKSGKTKVLNSFIDTIGSETTNGGYIILETDLESWLNIETDIVEMFKDTGDNLVVVVDDIDDTLNSNPESITDLFRIHEMDIFYLLTANSVDKTLHQGLGVNIIKHDVNITYDQLYNHYKSDNSVMGLMLNNKFTINKGDNLDIIFNKLIGNR